MAGGLLASPMPSLALPMPGLRRLKLFNANTRESFEGPYRDDAGPIAAAMQELSHLLRQAARGDAFRERQPDTVLRIWLKPRL